MILGVDRIKGMVENLCERELNNPEGAGLDIRLGAIYELVIDDHNGFGKEAFLGIEERQTPDVKQVAQYGPDQKFVFKQGGYWLVTTIEKVDTPKDIMILFRPRTTLFRCGLELLTAAVAPGYKGTLTFGLKNVGPVDVTIELGARIVHAYFNEVKGSTGMYRGQWQDGRVTTNGKEIQV